MRFLSNLHTHTTFSDGANTPEECVRAALEKGFVSLGFSEHGYTVYDSECCITKENIPVYLAEIARLKEAYRGQIEIYLGFEGDACQMPDKEGLDFTIGSVHYIHNADTDAYYNIDYQPAAFERAAEYLGGVRQLVTQYYRMLCEMAQAYQPDIIGHLDLVTMLNKENRYFDPDSSWYRSILEETAEQLGKTNCIVEVNTGAMARGYMREPYPSAYGLSLLQRAGVPVTLSSDAHSAANLDYAFEAALSHVRQAGYRTIMQMRGGQFAPISME